MNTELKLMKLIILFFLLINGNYIMSNTQQKVPGNELIIVREFDAPVEKVWRAWTEPEHTMKWWGPQDFTSPECKIDFRVGGKYIFCMKAPDGKLFWSTGKYLEIVPLQKIVCTDSFSDKDGNVVPASEYGMTGEFPLEMQVTVTFEAIGSKTKMTLIHVGIPGANMKDMTSAGWNQSFDKLEKSLAL